MDSLTSGWSRLKGSLTTAGSWLEAPLEPLWGHLKHTWDNLQQLIRMVGAEGPLGWDGFVGAAASSFVIVSFLLHCRDNIREFAREPNAGIAKLLAKTFGSLSSAGAIAAIRSSIAVIDVAVSPVLLVLAFFWFLVAWHAQSDQAAVS